MSLTPNDPQSGAARSYPAPADADGTAPPKTAPVTQGAGRAAETFVTDEVAEAKRSLMITRIASGLLAAFVVIYLGYITSRFKDAMEPNNAAEIAKGIVAQKVDDGATSIAEDIKKRVPALIEQLPDYAIKQMPEYREKLESQVVGDLSGYASQNAPKLGENLDEFLAAHKEEVGQMLQDGQDPAVADKVGEDLEAAFMKSLQETDAGGGETFREKLDKSLAALQDIKKKTDRLATAKDLTPQEKKTRRAIAIIASKINMDTAAPAVAPIKNAAASATSAIQNAAQTDTPPDAGDTPAPMASPMTPPATETTPKGTTPTGTTPKMMASPAAAPMAPMGSPAPMASPAPAAPAKM